MKKQFNNWLSQGKITKIIEELNKLYPDNQRIMLISARYQKYLEEYHDGTMSSSDSALRHTVLCKDLAKLIEDLYSDIQIQPSIAPNLLIPEFESRSPELQTQIEAFYQCIVEILKQIKESSMSKYEKQAMVKSSSSQIALLHFGNKKPPSYRDKPTMLPDTIMSCKVCTDRVRLKGNDQCPNCELSTYAWMLE